jgi:hypothetical protein
VVESLRNVTMEGLLFRTMRRRFRSRMLLAESAPERAAARWVGDAARGTGLRRLNAEVWLLTPESLRSGAAALGPPRVLVYGPDLSEESEANGRE